MNTEVIFSKKSDEWETPIELFNKLNQEFKFVLDPCANENNAKCERWFSMEENGLCQSWVGGNVWCNPPYSNVKEWVKKAYYEMVDYHVTTVMLLPSRTDTRYFHGYIWDRSNNQFRRGIKVRFLKGRLKFGGATNSAPFPSMLVIFSPDNW